MKFWVALPALIALLAGAPTAAADEPAYGRYYNGSFVETSVRGGIVDVTGSGRGGWLVDAGIRQAFPMHLLDTRLSVVREAYDTDGGDIVMYGGDLSFGFHPLYLALLYNNWLGYLVASWYVELSAGLRFSSLDSPSGDESDIGFSYGFGTGIDVPVTDPDQGWSLWLNGLYRYRRQDFDSDSGEIELHGHAFFVGLAIRKNGLLF